jgi:CIC family chloride channel protein
VKPIRLSRWQQLRLRENQLFLALTLVVGVLAGLSAVLFALSIDLTARVLFGVNPARLRLFLVPIGGSVVAGALLSWVFPAVRGSGVPQTKAAFHLHQGAIPARVPIGKFITGALCIGSGHSIGREGPSVQIGAGLASSIGRWARLSPARVKDLLAVGSAGALSAAFNTPVAAVLFTLEEIIGDLNASLLGSTVLASVSAVVVQRAILGNEPLFRVPAYHLEHPAELLAYATLGVVGGILSVAFSRGVLGLRAAFMRLPASTRILQPALGGVVIGGMLTVTPQVMGVGYEHVDQALNGGLLLQTMAVLCVMKIAATIVSYASGNAGGIFAPSLFIGAMAGGVVGALVQQAAPFPTADAGAYALVGMGTLFAGIVRAPMTSVFMIFEITQDYQILVPLMVANLLSFAISRRYQAVPLYNALLDQDRVHLPAAPERAAEGSLTAADVMAEAPSLVPADEPVVHLWDGGRTPRAVYLVGSGDRLAGIVRASRLEEAAREGRSDRPIGDLVDQPVIHGHPDHALDVVLERLSQSGGLLPIVARDDAEQLVGVITFEGIARTIKERRSPSPSIL